MTEGDLKQVLAGLGILVVPGVTLLAKYARQWMREKLEAMDRVPPSPGMPVPEGRNPDDKFGESSLQRAADQLERTHEAEMRRRDRQLALLQTALAQRNADNALQAAYIAELEERLAAVYSGHATPPEAQPEQPTPLVLEITPFDVIEEDGTPTLPPGAKRR